MTTHALPPYRAMLAVDVKNFSARPARQHEDLTERIPRILVAAFVRAGLGERWDLERRFSRSDGDGYTVGFEPQILPFLIDPVLTALQAELTERNADRRPDESAVTMRASISVGPVTDSGEERISDGSGTARIELHRLLNAEAVRQVLHRCGASTNIAAIVSHRALEDAVLGGFTDLDIDSFVEIPVREKSYRDRAFLRVPNLTGESLRSGLAPDPDTPDSHTGKGGADSSPHVGTLIGTSHGPVHSGTGDLFAGDEDHRGWRRDRH